MHDLKPYSGSLKVGDRSGRLTVTALPSNVNERDPTGHGRYLCHCRCDCGTDDYVCKVIDIQSGNVKSCGCIDRERLKPINIGDKFGRLTVVKEVERDPITNRRRYLCKCSCLEGGTRIVAADKLIGGETTSCGCKLYETRDEYAGRVKIGDVFGNLTVTEIPVGHIKGRSRTIICKCKCGTERFVTNASNLLSGATTSCGCRRNTHKTAEEYSLEEKLHGMKQRCYNQNFPGYEYWGGKGVIICNEWLQDTKAFIKWALENGYKLGDTIDRIDNNGPYAPWNCRFVGMKAQQNNKSNNVRLTVGRTTRTLSQWSDYLGISPSSLSHALKRRTKEEADQYLKDAVEEHRAKIAKRREELEKFCEETGISRQL